MSARSRIGRLAFAGATALAFGQPAIAGAPEVVASFKPVHALVAGIMEGVGEPILLVKGATSPHSYALTPSDAAALENADLVFWIGEAFETFLAKPLETLATKAEIVDLAGTEGLLLLPPREGGVWAAHEHERELAGEHQADDDVDGHLWLDPDNAELMVTQIAAALADRDPGNASIYRQNAETLSARLDALDREIAAALAPVRDVPFIVFHDAYQYFERHYGLAGAGSITVSPEQPPGARRLSEIRQKIEARGARCVFREPNFEPALVNAVIEGTAARTGVLDPEGAALAEGPSLYLELMRDLSAALRNCLRS